MIQEITGDLANRRCDFTLETLSDIGAAEKLWQELEYRCEPSLFQSWGWIETWLKTLPPYVIPSLLVGRNEQQVSALSIFNRHDRIRYGFLKSKGLYLNETGDKTLDRLTVEYNGILSAPDYSANILRQAIEFLCAHSPEWDELFLSGVSEGNADVVRAAGLSLHILSRQPYDYIDLASIRNTGESYLDRLSRNTRYQIRRSLRSYRKNGTVKAEVAGSVDTALDYFSKLKSFHQAYWNKRGQPGAFANPVFEKFHTAFIESRFDKGEIEMVAVKAGNDVIGYLYNILYRQRIYSYQSGFAYSDDKTLKPGLISHYLAIQRNLAEGVSVYDFMAGDAQHKRSLGTDRDHLVWISARRDRFKYKFEDSLRYLKNRLRSADMGH